MHDIEDEVNFTVRGQHLLKDVFDDYSAAEIAGIAAQVNTRLIADVAANFGRNLAKLFWRPYSKIRVN